MITVDARGNNGPVETSTHELQAVVRPMQLLVSTKAIMASEAPSQSHPKVFDTA
jgi:hypothetical protein